MARFSRILNCKKFLFMKKTLYKYFLLIIVLPLFANCRPDKELYYVEEAGLYLTLEKTDSGKWRIGISKNETDSVCDFVNLSVGPTDLGGPSLCYIPNESDHIYVIDIVDRVDSVNDCKFKITYYSRDNYLLYDSIAGKSDNDINMSLNDYYSGFSVFINDKYLGDAQKLTPTLLDSDELYIYLWIFAFILSNFFL